MTFSAEGFELTDWQQDAVAAWLNGVDGIGGRGTLEVVTGGGKTLIALTCAARLSEENPNLKVVVVVPTQALARQWADSITRYTTIARNQVGILGAGRRDSLDGKTALVAVLNTAARALPEITRTHDPVLLIVDEAHRAGAPKYSKVLDSPARYRLGLSATPDREEIGEDGEPLAYDEQVVGQKVGRVVFSFGLRDARLAGWLPNYTLSHHAVSLTSAERVRYDTLSRQVDDARDAIRGLGGDPLRARSLARRNDDLGEAARRWVSVTGQRKDLLYRAVERHRVAADLVAAAFDRARDATPPRVILFHERVREAESLRDELARRLPDVDVALEHSGLPERARREALSRFASGASPVLVSVKSLIEGIDVPEADTGISVASAASVRQRIQSLGRVLRRSSENPDKEARMHLLYVDDSVDDLIYGKADWSDITGEASNVYWKWDIDRDVPESLPGPPRQPLPVEEEAWSALSGSTLPAVWPGEVTGQEYSVDSTGVVHNAFKRLIVNPQGVGEMMQVLREDRGGRFRVTPVHRLVIVWDVRGESPMPWVVGKLAEPFLVADEVRTDTETDTAVQVDDTVLVPGAEYLGPSDKLGGTFRLSKRGQGAIERAVAGGKEIAETEGESLQAANARRVVDTWQQLGTPSSRFYVNSREHAWFEAEGGRRFLASVSGGFRWPE